MLISKRVIVTVPFIGFHKWKGAPEPVAYLAEEHRHTFTFRVEVSVADSDREVEFHLLQQAVRRIVPEFADKRATTLADLGIRFGFQSCEHLAERLGRRLIDDKFAVRAVEVWEDMECGARLEFLDV